MFFCRMHQFCYFRLAKLNFLSLLLKCCTIKSTTSTKAQHKKRNPFDQIEANLIHHLFYWPIHIYNKRICWHRFNGIFHYDTLVSLSLSRDFRWLFQSTKLCAHEALPQRQRVESKSDAASAQKMKNENETKNFSIQHAYEEGNAIE